MERKFRLDTGDRIVPMRQPSRRIFLGVLAVIIVLVVLIARQPSLEPPYKAQIKEAKTSHTNPEGIGAAANDTLGFSKVFVVGLPERTDKRDALTLTGALTGFNLEFIEGVKGESVSDKALPLGVDRQALMEGNLGSWRGHMNAIRR
jgi:hypothetical protein